MKNKRKHVSIKELLSKVWRIHAIFFANLCRASLGIIVLLSLATAHAGNQQGVNLPVYTLSDHIDGNTTTALDLLQEPGADGYISLPEAILASNNSDYLCQITFFSFGEITLSAPLPALNNASYGLLIDGDNDIVLNGESLSELECGLSIESSENTVRGITFKHFKGCALRISGETATDNIIEGCSFGEDESRHASESVGIHITEGAQNNVIGGLGETAENRIGTAGWLYHGILLDNGATKNVIQGNVIGETGEIGSSDSGNYYAVTFLEGTHHNTLGGSVEAARNVISGNAGGIRLSGSCDNIIQGNYIGLDPTGVEQVSNLYGIGLSYDSNRNLIGGAGRGARNVLANSSKEISIYSSHENVIHGNYLSTDASGSRSFFYVNTAIKISNGSTKNEVGGPDAGEGNVICGSIYENISIQDSGTDENIVQGNYIGTDHTGTQAFGNLCGSGLYISQGASSNLIGGTETGAGNLIAAHNGYGIRISHEGSNDNLIQGNLIGVDTTATQPLSNISGGVLIQDGTGTLIGGSEAGAGNLIAYNDGAGVKVHGPDATKTQILGNSIFMNEGGAIVLEEGANNNMAAPVFWMREPLEGTTLPGATLEIFADYGIQGEIYIDTITADASGFFSISGLNESYPDMNLSLTATDAEGNTSPLSVLAHRSDQNANHVLELSELLRMVQFFNEDTFHCDENSEDGFAPGPGDQSCVPHTADYSPQNWNISLSELLRIIQLYNVGAYHPCPAESSQDGFCIGDGLPTIETTPPYFPVYYPLDDSPI